MEPSCKTYCSASSGTLSLLRRALFGCTRESKITASEATVEMALMYWELSWRPSTRKAEEQLEGLLCPFSLQAMIVLEFLHKGDLREFLLSLTPEYVKIPLHMHFVNQGISEFNHLLYLDRIEIHYHVRLW